MPRARRGGAAAARAQRAGRARGTCPARPCSTSPASTPMAICCWRIPSARAADRPAGREPGAARRQASATASWRGLHRGRRGCLRGTADQGPAAAAERGDRHRRVGCATGCASAPPIARPGPSSWWRRAISAVREPGDLVVASDQCRSAAGSRPRHGQGAGRPARRSGGADA